MKKHQSGVTSGIPDMVSLFLMVYFSVDGCEGISHVTGVSFRRMDPKFMTIQKSQNKDKDKGNNSIVESNSKT